MMSDGLARIARAVLVAGTAVKAKTIQFELISSARAVIAGNAFAVADNRADRTAQLFAVALAVATGVVAALGIGGAAIRAAFVEIVRAATPFVTWGLDAGTLQWFRGRIGSASRIGPCHAARSHNTAESQQAPEESTT